MTISEISINRPVFAWMLMIGLIVFGAISFQRMGVSQLPDVDFPVVNIGLTLDNAAPEVMENDVVDPVEDAVMGIEGIRNVSSNASQGVANVTVEFELDRNIDVAMQEVQTRIAQALRKLPSKLDPPVITKTNPEDTPIMWVLLANNGTVSLSEQMIYARNFLKDQFSTISGVGSIMFGGYVDPNLRVWLSQKKLYNLDLTVDDVLSSIQNEQMEVPAGRIENKLKEFNVRLLGEARDAKDFGKIRISTRGGAPNYSPLYLNEVTSIEEGVADIRALSRLNGKTVVGLGIVKQRGSNAVAVADAVKQKLSVLTPLLPKGMALEAKLDTTKFIRDSVAELNFTLILAAALTSVVCFLFLGSLSSTFNVLLAIPTSIVGAFTILYFCHFTLNTFTLLGLSLAIGIVVDDAIMMLENIVRHGEMGKSRKLAALDGSREITFAALAATIAIVAIFVPVVFMKGIIGRFFYQYGITVTVAVLLSLIEALTLTPMRCSQFLQTAHDGNQSRLVQVIDRLMARLAAAYRVSLAYTLKARWVVLLATFALFIGSLWLLGPIRKELIPEQDQSLFVINIKAPVGTALAATSAKFEIAERYLAKLPEVKDYYTSIGKYQGSDIVNVGTIYVMLKELKERKATQIELMDKTRAELRVMIPDAEIFVQSQSLSGFTAARGFPIEFNVQGPDWPTLVASAQKIIEKLKKSDLVTDVNTDYQADMPEVEVIPDRDSAAEHGVSVQAMGAALNTLIGGTVFDSSTQFPKDGHRYDIRVRSEPGDHAEIANLNKILLRNNRGGSGELVPLSAVAKFHETHALQIISRFNRERAVPIYANVKNGASQQDALLAIQKIGKETLPQGYRIIMTGSTETFTESFMGLLFALLLGVVVAYMVLASQFNSFIHPVTVLLALPFSLSGAIFALFVTGQSINLFSMIGLILLMGIVKKNSILLVDFTNQRRAEGLGTVAALLEACPVRLRPILMTSIATIAGAIPAALALGPGAETRIPMAITIIGGVTISTFLTLFVVPCAYQIFSRLERPDPEEKGEVCAEPHEVAVAFSVVEKRGHES